MTTLTGIVMNLTSRQDLPTGYIYIFKNPSTRKRAICGILTWFMGQSTGIVVIANFAPTLFGGLGFNNELQLGLAIVWVTACQIGTFLSSQLIERLGRVKLLGKTLLYLAWALLTALSPGRLLLLHLPHCRGCSPEVLSRDDL